MLENMVKEIRRYKNAIIYNAHHDMTYVIKNYLEIEFFNGNIIKLSLDSNTDISKCDYLEVKKKGRKKYIFKNELA